MKIKSADEIYKVLDVALAQGTEPKTCAELMEDPTVREAACARYSPDVQIATNKLSDMLGFMWRRGVISRYNAPSSTSMARYAYGPKVQHEAEIHNLKPIAAPVRSIEASKPRFTITESSEAVTLEFEHVTIVIRSK